MELHSYVIFGIGIAVCLVAAGYIVLQTELRKREIREMTAKGYKWEFVISCSADPGSWDWVHPRDRRDYRNNVTDSNAAASSS